MPWPWRPRVSGPSRSFKISPFDRAHTTSYWRYSNYSSISCRFWDIQCRKMSWPWNQVRGHSRSPKVLSYISVL